MDRRRYLGALGVGCLTGVAGCLESSRSLLDSEPEPGRGDWGDGETILETPTEDRGSPSHPIHGHEMPSFTLPDPLTGEDVSSTALEGERSYLMTFFFTACPDGACPALLLRLRRAQADSIEAGYDDEFALLAMTFDPERDTPEVLETYAGQQGVDLEAGNWHFLRPESYKDGEQLLTDEFGLLLDRIEDEEELEEYEDVENGHEHDDSDDDSDHDHSDHDHGEYTFVHYNLILLVNEHGVVERSYPNALRTDSETIVEDVRAVVQH